MGWAVEGLCCPGLDPCLVGFYLQELVSAKLALAELHESYIKTRNELYRSKEKNLAIASKMTTLQTNFYIKAKTGATV